MLLKKVIVPAFDFYLSGFCMAHFMTRKLSMVVLQYSSVAPKRCRLCQQSMGPCGARHAPEII